MTVRPGHHDFLDLPWSVPLEEWSPPRLVEVVRGVHRHVVRFVDYGGRLYGLEELPDALAEREYRLLRRMAEDGLPAVEAVGLVTRSARAPQRRARGRADSRATWTGRCRTARCSAAAAPTTT